MKITIDLMSIEEIKGFITGNPEAPKNVRIYLAGSGCSGPAFGLALDDLKDDDLKYEQDDVTFIADKETYETYGNFTIEQFGQGFRVIPEKGVNASACSSCGGGCH
ncbi:Fe-S cluster assembly protein HesB [Peptostreptococcaceae bacterium AGR-M142]